MSLSIASLQLVDPWENFALKTKFSFAFLWSVYSVFSHKIYWEIVVRILLIGELKLIHAMPWWFMTTNHYFNLFLLGSVTSSGHNELTFHWLAAACSWWCLIGWFPVSNLLPCHVCMHPWGLIWHPSLWRIFHHHPAPVSPRWRIFHHHPAPVSPRCCITNAAMNTMRMTSKIPIAVGMLMFFIIQLCQCCSCRCPGAIGTRASAAAGWHPRYLSICGSRSQACRLNAAWGMNSARCAYYKSGNVYF